jgi:hypothetical protein
MMYSLKYPQMESGLGLHLLEDPTVFICGLLRLGVHSLTSGLPHTREHLHPTESLQTEKVSLAFFAESSPSSLSLRLLSSILSESLQIIPSNTLAIIE